MPLQESANNRIEVGDPQFWDSLYRQGEDGWDIGGPTPVFTELLKGNSLPSKGSALFLGSGNGHDAIMFAQHGYDVVGIDFASTAIQAAGQRAKKAGVQVEFIHTDIFDFKHAGRQFDIVVEYVTFCAIDPKRRDDYADVVARALPVGGLFVGLFFPLDGREGGPPFAVDVTDVINLFESRFDLVLSHKPLVSVKSRLGKEILTIWKKKSSTG